MAALDTNVLVRFLVQDDARQGAAATRLIRNGIKAGGALYIPVTVVLELEWLLRSSFTFDKAAVLQTMFGLLGSFELAFESEGAVEAALGNYADGKADFADCLHAALAMMAQEQPLWTFDRAAAKIDGARLLT